MDSNTNFDNQKILDTSKKAMKYLKKSIELNEESIRIGELFSDTINELNELISTKYQLVGSSENIAYPYELLVKFIGNDLTIEELNEIKTLLCVADFEIMDNDGFKSYNFTNDWMNKPEDMSEIIEIYNKNIQKIENGENIAQWLKNYFYRKT